MKFVFQPKRVNDILNETSQGRAILNSYKERPVLNPVDRTFIVHKSIQVYLENDLKFNREICKEIAEEITNLFPSELMACI